MHSRLYDFPENSNSLYKLQFGFRKKHPTEHALLNIVERIKKDLDNQTFVCDVFIDLEKAFATVSHKILLKKLHHYGIKGATNCWLTYYLSNRKQHVTIEGKSSDSMPISCGVPQGSILGPLLFLIYLNDMYRAAKYCTYHLADDTNLLYSNKNIYKLRKDVNSDLKLIFTWRCANQ